MNFIHGERLHKERKQWPKARRLLELETRSVHPRGKLQPEAKVSSLTIALAVAEGIKQDTEMQAKEVEKEQENLPLKAQYELVSKRLRIAEKKAEVLERQAKRHGISVVSASPAVAIIEPPTKQKLRVSAKLALMEHMRREEEQNKATRAEWEHKRQNPSPAEKACIEHILCSFESPLYHLPKELEK